MQEFKKKACAIAEQYREQLTSRGLQLSVSKRYFTKEPLNRNVLHPNLGVRIVNMIEKHFDNKREIKNGYNNHPNSYHCIILRFSPLEQFVKTDEVGIDYAFVVSKTERAHKGMPPEKTVCNKERTLKNIEKRILRILEKAEKSTPEKLCKETVADAFRYSLTNKYSYKKKILNKDPAFWEIAALIFFAVMTIIAVLIALGIRILFFS